MNYLELREVPALALDDPAHTGDFMDLAPKFHSSGVSVVSDKA